MSSNKGFTLVEVLVASVILFFVIVTLHTGFKQYSVYRQKQQEYERIYMTVLFIKDKLKDKDLSRLSETYGKLNGLSYKVAVKEISRRKNFVYNEVKALRGNFGSFRIILYEITLKIGNRHFTFYVTQYYK